MIDSKNDERSCGGGPCSWFPGLGIASSNRGKRTTRRVLSDVNFGSHIHFLHPNSPFQTQAFSSDRSQLHPANENDTSGWPIARATKMETPELRDPRVSQMPATPRPGKRGCGAAFERLLDTDFISPTIARGHQGNKRTSEFHRLPLHCHRCCQHLDQHPRIFVSS